MKEKRKEGLSRIVFFFTIYGVIREVLLHYNNPSAIDMKTILCYSGITLMGVFLYGICAYISNSLSHTAAYDLLYEIRVQLMEKMARISVTLLGLCLKQEDKAALQKEMADRLEQMTATIVEFIHGIPVITRWGHLNGISTTLMPLWIQSIERRKPTLSPWGYTMFSSGHRCCFCYRLPSCCSKRKVTFYPVC